MGKYWSILWKSTSFKCLCLWSCNDFMSDSASLSLDPVRWFRYENLHNKLLDSWAMKTSISHNQNNKKNIYKFRRLESVLFVWMILDVVRISVTYHHLKHDKKSKISINLEAAEGHGFYWLLWLMNTKSISFTIMFFSIDKLTLSFFFASGFYRTPAKWS